MFQSDSVINSLQSYICWQVILDIGHLFVFNCYSIFIKRLVRSYSNKRQNVFNFEKTIYTQVKSLVPT